jgi:hypothetical protein
MGFSSEDSEGNGDSSHSEFLNDEEEFYNPVVSQSDGEGRSNSDGYDHEGEEYGGDFENILHDATWHWPPLPVPQQSQTVQDAGPPVLVGSTKKVGRKPSVRDGILSSALARQRLRRDREQEGGPMAGTSQQGSVPALHSFLRPGQSRQSLHGPPPVDAAFPRSNVAARRSTLRPPSRSRPGPPHSTTGAPPPASMTAPTSSEHTKLRQGRHKSKILKKNGNWSTEALTLAMAAVEDGRKIKEAGEDFGIPPSTLRVHLMGTIQSRKRGKKAVMSEQEETTLVQYVQDMCDRAHPLNMTQLIMKAIQLTQHRETPFRDGIPGRGWLKWFRKRHPKLVIRLAQGLDTNRTKNLNARTVSTFYNNLKELLDKHQYEPAQIWNADETGCQAGRNRGGRVLAKIGTKYMREIIPNEREHVTVLICINSDGEYIPNLYIFKGKQRKDEYIRKCESGAVYAMQKKAWMSGYIFYKWLDHFFRNLEVRGGISQIKRHLLILDGHGSHVTLDVILKPREHGLDLLTLPSHTSHPLQPLDISVFKPFKTAFRVYRDMWVTKHKGMRTKKDTLAKWISKSLHAALTPQNIRSGFRAAGIYPFDMTKIDGKMTPSVGFEDNQKHEDLNSNTFSIEELQQEPDSVGEPQGTCIQYYVQGESDSDLEIYTGSQGDAMSSQGTSTDPERQSYIAQVLSLPTMPSTTAFQRRRKQPVIDWSHSQVLTLDSNVMALEEAASMKESAT